MTLAKIRGGGVELHIFNNNFALRYFLINNGVDPDVIVMAGLNNHTLVEVFKYENYNTNIRFQAPMIMTRTMIGYPKLPFNSYNMQYRGSNFIFNDDYVRYGTLMLIADEFKLNEIDGEIAELGVYHGDFSSLLNALFPNRTLYLFDTFEGFTDQDVQSERNLKSTSSNGMVFTGSFGDTNVDLVLSKMPYPNKCVIKKGRFPDTIPDEEIKFAFVSIDCDLYEPILAGLRYFYPRLSKYGYIMLHDYNGLFQEGIHKAVKEIELEFGERLHKVPIPDEGGTLVINK